MTGFLTLDIEVAPQASALTQQYPEDRSAPSNYKDPEKIAAWHIRDEADWRAGLAKASALNPRTGRIVAVGMANIEENSHNLAAQIRGEPMDMTNDTLVALLAEQETAIIATALDAICGANLVTFCGLNFDLPYLHVRAAILGLRIPYRISDYLRRYSTTPHADLSAILENWGMPEKGNSLQNWSRAFGIEVTDSTTGADIGAMVERGDSDGIRQHCLSDVALTAQLAQRMQAAGLF